MSFDQLKLAVGSDTGTPTPNVENEDVSPQTMSLAVSTWVHKIPFAGQKAVAVVGKGRTVNVEPLFVE